MPDSFIAEFHSSLFVISLSIFSLRSTLLLPVPLLACVVPTHVQKSQTSFSAFLAANCCHVLRTPFVPTVSILPLITTSLIIFTFIDGNPKTFFTSLLKLSEEAIPNGELVLLSAVNVIFWFGAAKLYCLSKSMICDKRVLFTHVLKHVQT